MDVIYDFETVGNNSMTAAPVCLAAFCFDRNRFVSNDPYQFKEVILKIANMPLKDREMLCSKALEKAKTLTWKKMMKKRLEYFLRKG